jgi:prevent-host-death family protein
MSETLVTMTSRTKQVSAAEFKAKCLALFDEVESRRSSFVITKRGRPVARVVPLPKSTTSSLRGSLLHEEDLLAPIDAVWDAES